jgi:hypothetical protein
MRRLLRPILILVTVLLFALPVVGWFVQFDLVAGRAWLSIYGNGAIAYWRPEPEGLHLYWRRTTEVGPPTYGVLPDAGEFAGAHYVILPYWLAAAWLAAAVPLWGWAGRRRRTEPAFPVTPDPTPPTSAGDP